MSESGRRVTAFGVVKALREALGLPASALDQEVLDATLAAIGGGKKKDDKKDEGGISGKHK